MTSVLDVLAPTIIFTVCSVATVPLIAFIRKKTRSHQGLFTLAWISTVFAAAAISIVRLGTEYYGQPQQSFLNVSLAGGNLLSVSSAFLVDSVSVYMSTVYLIVGFVSCIYGVFYVKASERLSERYYALMLMTIGSVTAASFSGDLLTLFIFWEVSAASSCFLIVYRKTRDSLEASMKFLIMVVIASGFVVYGLSIVYGLVGSLNFWAVREALTVLENKQLLVVAFAFIATGYGIETAIVPFHMWLPDAYTAAPSSSSALLSAVVDQASYYVILRILIYILTPPLILDWPYALAIFSAITMTIGNLFALAQTNVKRLISYVCIADIGYNLVAITSVTPLGIMGNLYFFLVGGMTTALSFMLVGIFNKAGLKTLEDFSGAGLKLPATSIALTIAMLSFSGVPPLAGFMAKYMVFTAAIESKIAWLAVVGVLNTVLQTAYFLRLIHYMYAKTPKKPMEKKIPRKLLAPPYLLVAAIIILGVYPALILGLTYPAAQQMGSLTA